MISEVGVSPAAGALGASADENLGKHSTAARSTPEVGSELNAGRSVNEASNGGRLAGSSGQSILYREERIAGKSAGRA
jgi:hypothetical protein